MSTPTDHDRSSSAPLVVENLTAAFVPLVVLLRVAGAKVYYLRASPRLTAAGWVGRLEAWLGLEKALPDELPYRTEVSCHYEALQAVEELFSKQTANRRLIDVFAGKLGSDKVELAYKKALVERLHNSVRTQAGLERARQSRRLRMIASEVDPGFPSARSINETPYWARAYSRIVAALQDGFWIAAYLLFPLYILSRIRNIGPSSAERARFTLGLRVYSSDLAFHSSQRTIDFLLDGKTLTRDNTLFCIETAIDDGYRAELAKRNYHCVELPTILRTVSMRFFKRVIMGEFLPLWTALLPLIWRADWSTLKTTLKSLRTYMIWKRFLEQYSLKHFVVYNDFGEQHVIRNIVLNRDATKTYYYLHSRNNDDVFAAEDEKGRFVYVLFSYLYYDRFLRWSRNSEELYKPNAIGQFVNIGSLWSEHIRQIAERQDFENLRRGYFAKVRGRASKIVAVFDTTFGYGDGIVMNPDDMVAFARDIRRLLDDYPETMVVFKEKNPRWFLPSPKVAAAYDELARHERCCLAPAYTEASEVNAVSDLSVTACFSSTTVEALGARKRAIFHDATAKFRGTYYDKFPFLVAHDYEGLKGLVQRYLYDLSKDDFEHWINEVVVDEIDAYADGRGITRVREMLSRENGEAKEKAGTAAAQA